MSSNSINTNSPYLANSNILADVNNVRKNNSLKLDQNKKSFLESAAKDVKNTIVSEKLEESQSIQDYNLRLQQNTPAAKLLNTTKAFNETNKNEKINYKKDSENFIELTETDDYEKVRNSSGSEGYYIVINELKTDTSKKNKLMNSLDRWRERINSTYHLGLQKQPGTLVNLIA